MPYEVVWLPSTRKTLDKIAAYIRKDNPAAAERVFEALNAAGQRLAKFPEAFPVVRGNLRQTAHSRYPYLIRYTIKGERVVITRILHSAQNR